MIRRVLQAVSFAGLIASCAWLWLEPGPEPVVTLLASVGTFIGTLAHSEVGFWALRLRQWLSRLRDKLFQSLLGQNYRQIECMAQLEFSWPPSGVIRHHKVIARRLSGNDGPSAVIALTHFGAYLGGYDFCLLEGHAPELALDDFDADGVPELAVTYHCGAHTMVLRLFRLNEFQILVPVPGSEIGSDWPEIVWRDDDKDGKREIYAKNRNWAGTPTAEWREVRYVLRDGRYEKDMEYWQSEHSHLKAERGAHNPGHHADG
jgi:hypothetical protein